MKKDRPEKFTATRDVGVLIAIGHDVTHPPHQIPGILPKGTHVTFKKPTGWPWDLVEVEMQDHGRFANGAVPPRIREGDYMGASFFVLQDDAERAFQRTTDMEPQQSAGG